MTRWLLTAGDFRRQGGMDAANHALAAFLARRADAEVHLVGHSVSPDLAMAPRVRVHNVPRPFDSHRLGQPLLRSAAERLQRRLGAVRSIANGGNADLADVNWVHYVHAAYEPRSARRRALGAITHRHNLRHETASLGRARLVICNSHRTAADITRLKGVEPERIRVVYYGIDPIRFAQIVPDERAQARRRLSLPDGRLTALFVGALGDRRKNFDTLFDAWRTLCGSADWDVDLIVAGTGAELPAWRSRAAEQIPRGRIEFLDFHADVASLLAAGDVLIHPARYEPYGLAVHEALSRGIPAFVSYGAGVAERYPIALRSMLLTDPESAAGLCTALRRWRSEMSLFNRQTTALAESFRSRTWDDMAGDIVSAIERGCASDPAAPPRSVALLETPLRGAAVLVRKLDSNGASFRVSRRLEPRRVNRPAPLVGGDMFVEEATCWICGHQQMRPLTDAAFELSAYRDQDPALAAYTGARVALCRCRECGFAQPDRVPALPGFFDRMYAQQWSAEWITREFEGGWKDLIFRNVLDGLEARLPPDRRALLDVGAHAGRFLQLAQRRGWSVEGVEVNPRTAAHAEQQTGARVHRMSALGLDGMGQRFDALTLTDVLEHIPDPLRMLGKARSALSAGGWLAVKVPCGPAQVLKERLRARVHRGYRPRLADNLVHVNHFSVRSLDLALNRAGFRNVRIEIGAPECPHQSAIGNLLRLTIYQAGRRLPFGLHSPCALNLQAFAQKP